VVPREETGATGFNPAPSGKDLTERKASFERNIFDTLDALERVAHNSLSRVVGVFAPFQRGHLFDRFNNLAVVTPSVDIYEEGGNLVVKTELPGIDKKDISIRIHDNSLIISGEKKSERTEGTKEYYRVERSSGSFERSIPLPEGVNSDKITARFNNGVLDIRMPISPEQRQGRKIAIE
jgi:HSP20 family protein